MDCLQWPRRDGTGARIPLPCAFLQAAWQGHDKLVATAAREVVDISSGAALRQAKRKQEAMAGSADNLTVNVNAECAVGVSAALRRLEVAAVAATNGVEVESDHGCSTIGEDSAAVAPAVTKRGDQPDQTLSAEEASEG